MPRKKPSNTASAPTPPTGAEGHEPGRAIALRSLDAMLLLAFLTLAFLLGVFPLNDTDFWWHLRTGDMIRANGSVPNVDPYLFGGKPEKPWIDLHWLFQVLLSFGYERGGVDLLTLAKGAVTTAAVALLITARRAAWPFWVMTLAWIPALFLLGGRMYVRPETLTLLYLSIFLAVLFRWKQRPWLAWILPAVQLLWVNTQGLFVLGPFLLVSAQADAALTMGSLGVEPRRWWRIVLPASFATIVVCLFNPYGFRGAAFPIQLASTMGSRVFESIAELQPLAQFVQQTGWGNVPLWVFLMTLMLAAASFVAPAIWSGAAWLSDWRARRSESVRKRKNKSAKNAIEEAAWRLSPFRAIVFLAFAVLSFKATRNSHQFAAIAGTVTAWNFGEWAAALAARRARTKKTASRGFEVASRLGVLGLMVGLCFAVTSNLYYQWQGEGRRFGLGEQPLWYPHEAIEFAGRPGMPERFACFHLGHAALWEYHHGPDRKVYCDARLEVIGPELYTEYQRLQSAIANGEGWERWFEANGWPGVLVDLVQPENASIAATLYADSQWRCVWLDPIAAVFVHRSYPAAEQPWDPRAVFFDADANWRKADDATLLALARALRDVASHLAAPKLDSGGRIVAPPRADLVGPLVLLGRGAAQRYADRHLGRPDGWKLVGQLESLRLPMDAQRRRQPGRDPFDPIIDLGLFRTTYALGRAANAGGDFATLVTLAGMYEARGMNEELLPLLERVLAMNATNVTQRRYQATAAERVGRLRETLGADGARAWSNRDELEREVERLLAIGRTRTAVQLLERAYPPRARGWEQTDRIATLWMHLGEPDRALTVWDEAVDVPRSAVRSARLGLARLVANDIKAARERFEAALSEEAELFEALYGLAVLEADAGHRNAALQAAERARAVAPGPAAEGIVERLLGILRER